MMTTTSRYAALSRAELATLVPELLLIGRADQLQLPREDWAAR